ncbi:type IV toxin-antitoxin system AbiEi family antitoxin domain-containing protein [Novosphingobium album (ex Liu et al. 2023)]|uniref:Transcriptional regulator, AbiEi antitoxin, Type IV TA system n=1 Tax=Novosphingobium album (ex Liu et al. 2023) TaxID=3031130 RepID=A0ABT5WWN6_9SPHN|nr:hypothetical protein [Novosphingobium album (ex Liu et al. 2023)]MDE8654261.1 hypothetical protein [Novosphingobium album (ex Liu et al. 2023)]
MSALASALSDGKLAGRVFDERQLGEAVGGGAARRYALVNRALKDGSLVRLKRGTYLLAQPSRAEAIHPFAVAQTLVPGSYVSFETALAHHGWIPEAVYTTASVTPGRKSLEFDTPVMGRFTFHPLAIHDYQFLVGVERQRFGALTAFVASPLRALLDLAALRKQRWTGLDWLTHGLRIDEHHLVSLKRKALAKMKPVYKHKLAGDFLRALELAVQAGGSPSPAGRSDD